MRGGGVTEGKLQKLVYCTRTVPEMEKVRGGGYRGRGATEGGGVTDYRGVRFEVF